MTKAVSLIINKPEISEEKRLDIQRFIHVALQTFSYAPDREEIQNLKTIVTDEDSFLKISAEMAPILKKEFLDQLYIDRLDRIKIEGYIPNGRLILIHGLSGVGKTVLLLKICQKLSQSNQLKCHYFDFKAINETLYKANDNNFPSNFKQIIYNNLKREYIDNSEDQIKKWIRHKFLFDSRYTEVKEKIIDLWQKPLDGYDWMKLLNLHGIQEKILSIDNDPNICLLLTFIKQSKSLLLCFDNVDRFSFNEQRMVLEESIHISNNVEIPILLTLRTSNFRRLSENGARGDIVYMDYIKQISQSKIEINELVSEENIPQNSEEIKYTIKDLLEKRLDFLRRHEKRVDLNRYFKELNRKYEWNMSFDSYYSEFWKIFNAITNTFFSENIYKYCNYNIREVLIHYFQFINKLIIEPEPNFSFNDLISNDDPSRTTHLRNYLYKWLLCAGESVPIYKSTIPNIFDLIEGNGFLLELKILSYLYNTQKNSDGVSFRQLVKDFWLLGYERPILRNTILNLSKDQYHNDMCTIWVDYNDENNIDDSNLIIMPSGKYFIETLSISRDYIFWTLLCTEYDREMIYEIFQMKKIDYLLTNNDEYKTQVVYNFINNYLIPLYSDETNNYIEKLDLPTNWKGTKFGYIASIFFIKDNSYMIRLIKSISASILHSSMTDEVSKAWYRKFDILLDKVKEIEEEFKRNQFTNT